MAEHIDQKEISYPLLDQIDCPQDLKQLKEDQLPQLCKEIRLFLLNTLSVNPGHLGSNLGVVEATVAMHYVYDSPNDQIIWDVGHQAYVHKLLTGRKKDFSTLRKWNGISGFPSPSESKHDSFIAGHASNSISAALGIAVANKIKGNDNKVIAFIGDGALTGGLAFEGLNNASSNPNDLLIILNDNNMSIDKNVGGLNKYLVNLLTNQTYNSLRSRLCHGLRKLNIVDDKQENRWKTFNNKLKSLVSGYNNIFDSFSIRYFGPIDGNDVERMVQVLQELKRINGPRLLHISTIKGKGYTHAEEEPTIWHAPGKFDPNTGERKVGKETNESLKYQDIFGHTLVELSDMDERVVGVTPAMPSGCSMNILMKLKPEKVYDVGIAEGHAVTFSSGLATAGLIPFCNIYSTFMQRAYDQLIHDVALQKSKVIFCLDRAGLVGEDGATHNGAFDLAYLRTIPNINIVAPMNEIELRNQMYSAYKSWEGSTAIRYPRGKGEIVEWQKDFELCPYGKGRLLVESNKLFFLSIGTIGTEVDKVVQKLRAEGYDVGHIDMVFVKPLDIELLDSIAQRGVKIITVEEGTLNGGFGSAVAEYLLDKNYNNKLKRLGIPDEFIAHGSPKEQKQYCKIDHDSIYQAAIKLLAE